MTISMFTVYLRKWGSGPLIKLMYCGTPYVEAIRYLPHWCILLRTTHKMQYTYFLVLYPVLSYSSYTCTLSGPWASSWNVAEVSVPSLAYPVLSLAGAELHTNRQKEKEPDHSTAGVPVLRVWLLWLHTSSGTCSWLHQQQLMCPP